MPTTTGFRDETGAIDIATKFVTKEYLLDFYPDLVPAALTPRLLLWGQNTNGQLGTNNTSTYSSPVETVSRGTNWKQVSCGSSHTGMIKTDGTLWTCGYNRHGRLGDNTSSNRSSPVTTTGGGTNWRQVSCGNAHTAAIKTDGTLWSCGYNIRGALGDNTSSSRLSPVTTVAGGTNWKRVTAGTQFTAAIKTDGTLWTWGANGSFQLGDGTSTSRSSPVTTTGGGTTWKQLDCGNNYIAAIKTDGTLWTWGGDTYGELGATSRNFTRSSPVTIAAGGTNWKQVACGSFHTAAIKTDGTLWSWGYNVYGQLGDNTTSSRLSPVTTVAGGTNWKQVACSQEHTASIKTDGTLWTWGRNSAGYLGDNTSSDRSSPVTTVAGGTNWKQVSQGQFSAAAIQESEGW